MTQKPLHNNDRAKARQDWLEAVDAKKRASLALKRANTSVDRAETKLLETRGTHTMGLTGQGMASAAMHLQDALAKRVDAEHDATTAEKRHKRAWDAYKLWADQDDEEAVAYPWVPTPAAPKADVVAMAKDLVRETGSPGNALLVVKAEKARRDAKAKPAKKAKRGA